MTFEDDSRKVSAKTRRENVRKLLINPPAGSDGWISGVTLCDPAIGGSEGLRRVRELRAEGWTIEKRRMANSDAFEYRLLL